LSFNLKCLFHANDKSAVNPLVESVFVIAELETSNEVQPISNLIARRAGRQPAESYRMACVPGLNKGRHQFIKRVKLTSPTNLSRVDVRIAAYGTGELAVRRIRFAYKAE